MKKKRICIMIIALVWLTISLPFVYGAYQQLHSQLDFSTNTTEEKTANSINTLSEYLHDYEATSHPEFGIEKTYRVHSDKVFIAFHPDYNSPPPDC